MKVENTNLPGVLLLTPKLFGDDRGFFLESYNQKTYEDLGLPTHFVQDNYSRSSKGVLRGLHLQYPQWQGKLVSVVQGEIYDVAVDVRRDSPTFGQWVGIYLNASTKRQFLYIPPGFAHGFCVVSDIADVCYKCTDFYKPEDEVSLIWDDPDIGIEWPVVNPILSPKDAKGLALKDIDVI